MQQFSNNIRRRFYKIPHFELVDIVQTINKCMRSRSSKSGKESMWKNKNGDQRSVEAQFNEGKT